MRVSGRLCTQLIQTGPHPQWFGTQTGNLACNTLEFLKLSEKFTMKSDTQLQQDVMAELNWEPSVHAAQIGVEVKDGVVTLAGQVGSYPEKWNAETAAQRVNGVKALVVNMEVQLPALMQRSDEDIARSVENTLEWMAPKGKDAINVMVEHGQVVITGEVEWQYQKTAAADAIRHLVGVTGVVNQIGLKHQVSRAEVKQEIEAALTRQAHADAKKIMVEVKGSDVTLTGFVESWAERQSALHAAWSAPSVMNVTDRLILSF
jgi:osmotically-inducible protein OsmY